METLSNVIFLFEKSNISQAMAFRFLNFLTNKRRKAVTKWSTNLLILPNYLLFYGCQFLIFCYRMALGGPFFYDEAFFPETKKIIITIMKLEKKCLLGDRDFQREKKKWLFSVNPLLLTLISPAFPQKWLKATRKCELTQNRKTYLKMNNSIKFGLDLKQLRMLALVFYF